jgi:hypothetical protein
VFKFFCCHRDIGLWLVKRLHQIWEIMANKLGILFSVNIVNFILKYNQLNSLNPLSRSSFHPNNQRFRLFMKENTI